MRRFIGLQMLEVPNFEQISVNFALSPANVVAERILSIRSRAFLFAQ